MSYDGGLSVKIANDVMLGILQKYKDNGVFEESSAIQNMIGHKYRKQSTRLTLALYWHYMDAAEISTCPKTLEQVLDAAIELLDHFADDDGIEYDQAYKDCIRELKDNRDAINSSYEFVEWEYFPSDYEHAAEGRDEETFEWKEGIENYTGNPAPEPASVEFDRDAVGKLNADLWLEDYGTYLEQDPVIDFNGTRFVFTGLTETEKEKDNPVVQKLTLKGGQHRKNVSGKTDYLVVAPEWAGVSKIEAVLEQRKNGKSIKVILLEDLKKALDEPDAADTAASEKNETYNAEEKTEKTSATKAEFDKNFKYRVREEDMYFFGRTYPKGIIIDEYIGDSCMVVVPEEVNGMKVVLVSGLGDCPNVTKVEIPDSVDYSDDAFDGCPKLADKDGILVIKGRLLSFRINSACVEIPADKGIKYISGRPFQKNEQITEIVLPNGLLEVEHSAFRDCKNLKTVRFPDSLKEIGVAAFENCAALERLSFPDGLVKIGMAAFEGCGSLSSVTINPNTECEERAFSTGNRSNLAREDGYTVINGVMYDVDYRIFKGNKEFVVDIPHDVKAIAGSIIFNSPGATIDRFTITDQVRLINADDFFVSSIERFRIIDHDDGHTLFETDYFNGNRDDADDLLVSSEDFGTFCELIEEQDYDKLNELFGPDDPSMYLAISKTKQTKDGPDTGRAAQIRWAHVKEKDCEIDYFGTLTGYKGKSKNIILPDSVRVIGNDAFSNSDTLEAVLVPEGVEKIESEAFSYCTNLKKVYLPSSLEAIEREVFWKCEALESIVIPDGCEEIGSDCFTFCENLTDIYVPSSMCSIDPDAFCTYNDETVIHTEPGSEAETYARENDMKYDYKPAPDLSAVYEAAYAKPETKTVKSKPDIADTPITPETPVTADTASKESDFQIKDGVLEKYKGSAPHAKIPSGIKKIGHEAFCGNRKLETVTIPEGVTVIEWQAFEGCKNLRSVSFPESLKEIGISAFSKCTSMTSAELRGNVTKINDFAFSDCTAIASVSLPSGLTKLGGYAFCDCSGLTEIKIPDTVKTMGENVFSNCTQLRSASLPSELKTLPPNAFYQCKSLSTVILPVALKKISESAFQSCENLREIVISEGVTDLEFGKFVFLLCRNITVKLPESLVSIKPENALKEIAIEKLIVYKGSFGETYAKKNGKKYEAILTEKQKEERRREEEALQAELRRQEELRRREAKERAAAALKAQRESLQREITGLEREIGELQARRALLEEKIAGSIRKSSELLSEKQLQEKIVEENRGIFGQKARKRKEAQAKILAIETDMAEASRAADDLTRQCGDIKLRENELQVKLETRRRTLATLEQ